jgi:hypothetical protein
MERVAKVLSQLAEQVRSLINNTHLFSQKEMNRIAYYAEESLARLCFAGAGVHPALSQCPHCSFFFAKRARW